MKKHILHNTKELYHHIYYFNRVQPFLDIYEHIQAQQLSENTKQSLHYVYLLSYLLNYRECNWIKHKGASLIAKIIEQFKPFTALTISNVRFNIGIFRNIILHEGVNTMASAIQQFYSITTLHVCTIILKIGKKGIKQTQKGASATSTATQLSKPLAKLNTSIIIFNVGLEYNNIGYEWAIQSQDYLLVCM